MKIKQITNLVKDLDNSLKTITPNLKIEVVPSREKLFKDWFREEVPYKDFSKKSGVYIFSDINNNILYIGKAASDNLGAEIYSKFGAASKVENDIPYFGNSKMAKNAPKPYAAKIYNGDVLIQCFCISPKEYTSVFEVYLQAFCTVNQGLPPLNKQIG